MNWIVYFLFDSALVECGRIFGGICKMLLIGACEIVSAAEIFFGAHIEVVVMHHVEHGIESGNRRNANGTGRKCRSPA